MTAMSKHRTGLFLPFAEHRPTPMKKLGLYRWKQMTRTEREAALDLGYTLPTIAGGAAKTYAVWNGTQPTTAALVKVTTGTAIKTLLQVQTGSSIGLRVIEWGIAFDGVVATPIEVELIDTAAIAATVTTFASTDIVQMNGPNDNASNVVRGTSASGFTATAEGSIVAGRLGDYQLVAQQFSKQFPLGREFEVSTSKNLRIRVTAASALSAVCYVVWEE